MNQSPDTENGLERLIDRNDDVAFATPACAAEALGTTSETSAPSPASALR